MLQNTKEQKMTNWSWQPGSKHSGFLPVYGGGAELPVTLICGDKPGPMVLISEECTVLSMSESRQQLNCLPS